MIEKKAILQAMDAAPIIAYTSGATDMHSLDGNNAAPDVSPNLIDAANLVAPTLTDFQEMLETVNGHLSEKARVDVNEEIFHESAHARAAAKVGAVATYYGVHFFQAVDLSGYEDPYVVIQPFTKHSFDKEMSPLVLASVLAHPRNPSASDMAEIRGLGYDDIQELGQHIYEGNRDYDLGLLLPLSWKWYDTHE